MSSNVEMSLDEIIKKSRKNGGGKPGKKGGVRKGKFGQTKIVKKKQGGQKPAAGGTTAATKRLVQKLVKKALSENNGGRKIGKQQGRVVRKVIRNGGRGVSQRSQVIKKSPRTETVIVRRQIVKPRSQPRQQIIREVIVQEPVRQRIINRPVQRRFNRPKVVYVQQQQSRGPPQRSFNRNFQQRPRFQQQQRRNNDPFYEPASFLQRL